MEELWMFPSERSESDISVGLSPPQSLGRHAKRSASGCWTCKDSKVRCDEQRPACARCSRLNRHCDYMPRPRKLYSRRKRAEINNNALSSRRCEGNKHDFGPPKRKQVVSVYPFDGPPANFLASLETVDLLSKSLDTPSVISASSLVLGEQEREAIQYFQTTFSRLHHTKNPQFNVISVIFSIATKSALAMHMVISIARREMLCLQGRGQVDVEDDNTSIIHYSAALQKVGDFVNGADKETGLDQILATIWLMLLYEQKFGDGDGTALSNHLKGLASLAQSKARTALMLPADQNHRASPSVNTMELYAPSEVNHIPSLSLFSARMLVWISLLDAGAAATGLGGNFNESLHRMLEEHVDTCQGCDPRLQTSLFRSYTSMQVYSNPLFCKVWGEEYPASEIMDDIDNHEIFLLYGQCFQLRYMVSRLYTMKGQHSHLAVQCQNMIELGFREISERYTETFILANKLSKEIDHSTRAIKNIRFIVAHYHAAVLYYLRCIDPEESFPAKRMLSLKGIMNLAVQAFDHEKDEAMLRIAWPLFIAFLETDDLLHRSWLGPRLRALGKYGKNYARAAAFADGFVSEEKRQGKKLNFRDFLKSGNFEQFAI